MSELTAPVTPDPVEELEKKLRMEAVESAKRALAELIPLLDPESKTVQRVLRLIKTTAAIHAQLIGSFSGDVLKHGGYPGTSSMPPVEEEGEEGNIEILENPMPPFGLTSSESETFGNQAISQLFSLGKSLLSPKGHPLEDIRSLVEALAIATEANLPDNVRLGIEKKLKQALGGDGPPDSLPTVKELMEETK